MKIKFSLFCFFLILNSLISLGQFNTQIISRDNKYFIALTEEQSLKLKEILNQENQINKIPFEKLDDKTFLISEKNINISSICQEENFVEKSFKSCKFILLKKVLKEEEEKIKKFNKEEDVSTFTFYLFLGITTGKNNL